MRYFFSILTFLPLVAFCQLYIGNSARLYVGEGNELRVGPVLENNGDIDNLGQITLISDWSTNNLYNGPGGAIEFYGKSDQSAPEENLEIDELIINSLGNVTFPGNEHTISERIDFKNGLVKPGENTRFILDENVVTLGGSNVSYFDGSIISKGSGLNKFFPVGSDGIYAPLTLSDLFGSDLEVEVTYNRDNPVDPEPGDSLLGVSHRAYWEMELLNGVVSRETPVQLEFSEEDLSDFRIQNNIRFRSSSPAVAFTRNLTNRWQSLGVSDISNSDSLTFGQITSGISFAPELGEKIFFAVALAPIAPSTGLIYVPEVFSPNAQDPDNKFFKIFGQRIKDEDFDLQIFNRLGIRVFSTTSFAEANQNGWDGTNPSGGDEPTGVYYYTLKLTFDRGQVIERSGAFYLVR